MKRLLTAVCIGALVGAAGQALGQDRLGQSARVVTTPSGTFLVKRTGLFGLPGGSNPADSVLWTEQEAISIPQSGALGGANSTWIGEAVNTERLQRFVTTGAGTPEAEFPGTHATGNPALAAAAAGADLAVFMDQQGQDGVLEVRAYNSTVASGGAPLWTFDFPANFNSANLHYLKVSRDGAVVAALANDNMAQTTRCYFLDGATGDRISTWDPPSGVMGGATGVDLTDDGSQAIICHVSTARVIDTATGMETFSVQGSGAGGRYQISGDGSVIVVGGFSFQVYKKIAGNYTQVINFSAPTSWFGWASAVSRDGSTVGVLTHNYSNFVTTQTRIWDVDSAQLLGTFTTTGSGTLQDSASDAAMSDHGERFIVASWGTQDNSHRPVMVFDRGVNMIDGLQTRGSPWAVDISGDGTTCLATNKAAHANTFGNGGDVTVFTVAGGAPPCYPNCDNSTTAPILNVNDFICFQSKFAAGDTSANCDQSTQPPVLNVNDFICFQSQFAAGC